MYKELFILAVGIILGMIIMYYILKSKIGSKYEIDNDIKVKKGTMADTTFKSGIDSETPKKQGFFKRQKEKRQLKKNSKI